MAAIMLPDDTGHDFLVHDAYQGAAAPAVDSASHAQRDQVLAAATVAEPAAVTPAVSPTPAAPATTSTSTSTAAAPASATPSTTIASSDPTRTIFLGDDAAGGLDSNGALYISNDALGNLTGGYSHILVGGADSNAHIVIGDTSGAKAIVLTDSLTLMNPQAGGEIFINQKLQLEGDSGLTIVGSGHTTIIANDTSAAHLSVIDSVEINGTNPNDATDHTVTLTANSGGIQIGNQSSHTLNGAGLASDDRLVMAATGDIEIYGTVGNTDPLNSLIVTTAHDVHFRDAVTINGNLFINATGTITFDKAVHLTAGSLHVTGAGIVHFNAGVVIDGGGDVLLEGNEIDLATGEGGFKGTGSLTLRPTSVNMNIDVAGPPLEDSADLNLSSAELAAFDNTFSKIIIGRVSGSHADPGAGDVRIGAIQVAQQFTLRDQVEIYGRNITVEDFANAGLNFLVSGNITLDAFHDITINNRLDAVNGNVTLYASTGAITQADGGADSDGVTSETVRGFDLHAHAGNGINLPWLQVNTVSAVNTGDGALTIGNLARDVGRAIGGALQIDEISQTSLLGDAITISTSAGSISIAAAPGTGVHTVSGGAIGISAGGAGNQITVNQDIGGTSGAISLQADGTINVALATISASGAGAIALTSASSDINVARNISSAGGLVALAAGGAVSMVSGTAISSVDSIGDAGAVTINAVGAITVSTIHADGAITLASSANAIIDGLTGNGFNLDGDSATATLAAASGIGSSAPLYTRVAALGVNNTTSGNVFVREATAVRLLGTSLAGSGANLAVVTFDGGIAVEGVVNSAGASGTGNILLQAGQLAGTTAASIDVRANIGSTLGSVSLVAADGVLIDDLGASAPLIEARAAGKTIDIAAGAAVTMEAQARLQTNNGNIRIDTGAGHITLGIASAGTAAIALRAAGGSILDAQNDDATVRVLNLSAASMLLAAGGSVGAGSNAIETSAGLLAISGSGAWLRGSGQLTLGSVAAVTVERVAADASVTSVGGSAVLSGATTSNGSLVLVGDSITINQALSVSGGNLLLESLVGAVTVNAAATADLNITVLSNGGIDLNAGAIVSALAGSIDLASLSGAIAMADGARAVTNANNIRLSSGTSATIGLLDARSNAERAGASLSGQASWGNVSVNASGAIADSAESGATTDIYAATLRVNGGATGTGEDALDIEAASLSAASTGALFLNEASALTLAPSAAISVARVLADGSVTSFVVTDALQSNVQAAGVLVLQAAGAVSTVSGGALAAGGNLLLAAGGAITLGDAVATSGATGNISIHAGQDLLQNAAISAAGAAQSIDLVAARDILMADGATTTSNAGNIGLRAGANAVIETVDAGLADVSVNAGGSIGDQDADGDSEADILAVKLQMSAAGAIGAAVNAIETSVGTLTARSGSAGVYLADTDDLIVDTVSVQVSRVGADGLGAATSYAAQSNLVATGAGNIVLRATDLTVSDDVSAASGNVLLAARTGNLTINNSVTSSSGAISLASGAALVQKALVSGTSIDAVGATALSIDDGVSAIASGNIRYQTSGMLSVGTISSGAMVSLVADSVIDSGSSDTDIVATTLRIATSSGFGSANAHLKTSIASLGGSAGAGGLFIDESDDLQIDALGAIDSARVNADGTLSVVQDASTGSFSSGSAAIASGGALGVNVVTDVTGNLLLQASGAAGDLAVSAQLSVTSGSATLVAGRDLLIDSTVRTLTVRQSLDLQAARDITMAQGSSRASSLGNAALAAGRNATIELVSATDSVSIIAQTGFIVDGDLAGDTEVDISASSLLLRAASAIGSGSNHLETTIGTLSAQGGSAGVYLTETDSVTVDGVTVQVNRVDGRSVATATTNAMQNNLTAAGSGNIVLVSNAGTMTVSDTLSTASGNLLLQAASGGLVINDAISVAGGTLSITSAGSLALKATISNTGAGTIDMTALGALSMDDGTSISNTANMRLSAGTVMTVGAISSSAAVQLVAGAIIDSGSTDIDVTAAALAIVANNVSVNGTGIGSASRHLQIAVATLAGASAGSAAGNGIYLDAVGAVTVDSIPQIFVNRVALDGSSTVAGSALTSDLSSTGDLVLSASGAITINQGSANGVGARAAGNLLLQSSGATGDINLNAEVLALGGAVTIDAGRDLHAASSVITSATGASVDLSAARTVTMLEASRLQTNAGNVLVRAGADATIALIDAGAGSIAVAAGASIIDQDGSADSALDIVGDALQLSAGNAIGSAASSLETRVNTLSATSGAGGVYISEADALVVDSVTVQVSRVDAGGATTRTSNAVQSGLSASGAGNIAISASTIVISDDVTSVAGAILLNARTGGLTQNNALTSAGGAISVLAAGAIAQKAAIGAGATVDLASSNGAVIMDDGVVTTAGGNVRYAAGGAISIGAIVSAANVSLAGATIADAGGAQVDVSANALRLATSQAGDLHLQTSVNTVAARVQGGVSLADTDGLTVGSVAAIDVSRLAQDGSVTIVTDAAMVALANAGNLLLQTGGAGDLVLANAIDSTGSISLNSARDIIQDAALASSGAGNSADLLAARHINMGASGVIVTNAGAISLRAVSGNVTIGVVDARSTLDSNAGQRNGQTGWGAVSLSAAGTILDKLELTAATDVFASSLSASASTLGSAANALELEVASLSGAIGSGGVFVADASALVIGANAVVTVNRVAYDGSTSALNSDAQVGLSSGAAAVVTSSGSLNIGSVVAVSGNLLLQSNDDILLDASVSSNAGSISMNAARDLIQHAAIATAASGKSIDLLAGRDIAMAAGSTSTTNNGNLLLAAGRDITVAALHAGSGSVGIHAGASIVDQDGAGDTRLNIRAAGLQLNAGNAIGAAANHLEVAVGALSAAAGAGGMYIAEADGVSVAALAVQAQRIDTAANASTTASSAQADLRSTGNGNIVLTSAAGQLILNGGAVSADGSGNVLIAGADIAVNGNLASAAGNVSVLASGLIAMLGNTSISGTQVRVVAGASLALGNVSASSALLSAGGAISVASGSAVNVNAASLRLQAGGAIGSGAVKLSTAVDTLSASAAGMYIDERDGVVIQAVAPVSQVNLDGSSSASADSLLAGLVSIANGSIVLSAGGAVAVADAGLVAADGSGNLLLRARSGTLALGLNADVTSASGHISLIASGAITLASGADVRTAAGGDIDLDTGAGFTQRAGSTIANTDGSIRLQAAGDVLLASIASAGNVAVTSASGSIGADGDAATEIAAEGLRLSAAGGIGRLGANADALDIAAGTVSARAGTGGINLSEASDIVVGDVANAVNVVNADGSISIVNTARQGDLRTVDNGSIVLNAANSFIILNEGNGPVDGAVVADGSGNVLLNAGVSIIVNADVMSGSGHVSLLGSSLIEFKANADIRTGGAGSIDVEASTGAILQNASSLFSTDSGALRLRAQTNVTIGDIVSGGDVSVSAVSGFIRDADALINGVNDSDNDITARAVRLAAGAAIGLVDLTGSSGNAIETAVGTLSARAGGAIGIANSGALSLGSVAVSAYRAGLDGVAVPVGDAAQSGVTGNGAFVLNLDGDLTIDADLSATSINLVSESAVNIGAGVTVAATGAAATIDASGGALTMAGSARVNGSGNLRLHAASDVVVGNLSATNVSLVADSGAIVNAAGSSRNISATTLRLQADDAIGSAARSLTSAVGTVSAASRGTDSNGIWLTEDDALIIGSTGFGVDAAQTGLRAANGSIGVDAGGAISMAGAVNVVAAGSLTLHASNGAISIGNLSASTVSLNADSGAIVNAAGSSKNITADSAVLRAGAAIGTNARSVSTSLAGLDASSSALYVVEDNAIRLTGLRAGSGNLVLTTIDGAIAVDGAVAASRNVLLAAGGADLVLGSSVTSAAGSISLSAGRDLLANAAVQTLAAAQTVDLVAAASLAMGEGSSIATLDSAVLLTAGGDVTIESVNAGSASVGINAGGSVIDQDPAGDTDTDINAGALRISAGGQIGNSSNHLETRVATFAAAAGGSVVVDARDGVVIGSVDVAIGRIDASGVRSIVSAGALAGITAALDVDLAAAGAISQLANIGATGSVQLRSGGAIAMADGSVTSAAAISYTGAGDILAGLLDAGSGSVTINAGASIADAQAASAVQTLNVRAGSASLRAASGIGATANAIETAVVTLSANSASGDLVIRERDSMQIGAAGLSAASGNVVLMLDSGTLNLSHSFNSAAGKDLTLAADHIVFEQAVRGNGGKLTISAANPVADVRAGSGGVIDQASLAQVGGYALVVLGAGVDGNGQDVRLDGSGTPLGLNDALLLNVSGSGSVITVAGQVTLQSLDARAALAVDGNVSIAAGNGAAVSGGDMLFEQGIDGAAPGAVLALAAGGDNVVIQGAIGAIQALAGFSIDNAANVSFARNVTVAGPVLINASGVVRFDGVLTLDNGSITIRGASEVIIGDVLFHGHGGVVVIEANTLTLNGDVQGAGAVTLHPTDSGREIVVGGSSVNGAYNVTAAQLAHLATATQVIIGTQGTDGHAAPGAGPVTVNAVDFAALTGAPVQVYGSVVTLAAGSGTLQAANGLVLDGRDGVVLHDSIGSTLGDIKVYSALGGVSMDADAVIAGSAAVTLQGAGSLAVGLVQGREVVLRSGGMIVDAAADDKVNVTASSVSIIGYGPKLGSGNAVEVQAPAIYVSAPTGMVLQDTGADGRTHFYLLDGATMYEQAIAIGTVTRSTGAPAAVSGMQTALPAPVTFSAAAVAAFAEHASSAASYLASLHFVSAAGADDTGVLTASTNGLHAAALAGKGDTFDFWLEDLML